MSAPSPNRLRVSPFPNVLEVEPNDTPDMISDRRLTPRRSPNCPWRSTASSASPATSIASASGRRRASSSRFHALANALGSPLDPVIWIKPVGGKLNAAPQRATDSRPNQLGFAPAGGLNRESLDPVLEFTAPADGEYVLGIEDERGEGGSDYVYRIEARPEENAVYTYIAPEPENQYQPQLRQSIAVAPGNRFTDPGRGLQHQPAVQRRVGVGRRELAQGCHRACPETGRRA